MKAEKKMPPSRLRSPAKSALQSTPR